MSGFQLGGSGYPGAIDMAKVHPDLPRDATELARVWVNSERSFVAVGFQREWSPELFGSLLVECLHTAADAYSVATGMPPEETLRLLWKGLDDERESLSTNPSKDVH
jgi:hypothetical protein